MNTPQTQKKTNKKPLSEKDLIKKYEAPKIKNDFASKKQMYIEQTDKNYKDGDRNWLK